MSCRSVQWWREATVTYAALVGTARLSRRFEKPYAPKRMIDLVLAVAGAALILAELFIWDAEILWHEPKRDQRNFPPPR
jgi:hypothetical protein